MYKQIKWEKQTTIYLEYKKINELQWYYWAD